MAIISSNTAVIKFTNSFAPGPSSRRSWTWPPRSKQRSPGTDKSDVTLRICTRAAIFLSSHTDPAPAIFAGVKARYDLRSSLVHGGIIIQKQLEKWLAVVSTVPAAGDCTPRMRNGRLIDRLRDLVRRAILMRLLLTATAGGRYAPTRHRLSTSCGQTRTLPGSGEPPGTRAPQTSALPVSPGPHHRCGTASLMITPAKPTDQRRSARSVPRELTVGSPATRIPRGHVTAHALKACRRCTFRA
jgi:hypothetical protein